MRAVFPRHAALGDETEISLMHQRSPLEGVFGVLVWGLDSFSSYAYPAGGNAGQLAVLDPLL